MRFASRSVVLAVAGIVGMLTSGACAKDDAGESAAVDTSGRRADSATTRSPVVPPGAASPTVAPPGAASPTVAPPGAASPPAGAPPAGPEGTSVMTGVFTAAQAARGNEVYSTSCAQCHTMAQHSGGAFAAAWNGRRLSDLYEIVHNTMPVDNPGGLTDQEYIDVIAYVLQLNGVPAGKTPLPADAAALRGLRIEVKPSAGEE